MGYYFQIHGSLSNVSTVNLGLRYDRTYPAYGLPETADLTAASKPVPSTSTVDLRRPEAYPLPDVPWPCSLHPRRRQPAGPCGECER